MKDKINKTDTILDQIVSHKIEENRERYHRIKSFPARQSGIQDFAAALRRPDPAGFAIIAEIKKASPSRGLIRPDFEPRAIARAYQEAGARAVSVLTEQKFFQGSMDYLSAVREEINIPLLAKDFFIDPRQLDEAYSRGADAALLIVRILNDELLGSLYEHIRSLGLAALIEVHDERDIERAALLHPEIIGINNRDLQTFVTDLKTTLHLITHIRGDATVVAESGLHHSRDLRRLYEAGVHAFLIGEDLMHSDDAGARLKELRLDLD